MNDLIDYIFNNENVDARRLHQLLWIEKDFSDWFKVQIARAGLVEHEDYREVPPQVRVSGRGGRNRREYVLSSSAAKHIAMMSNTEGGKKVRDFFNNRVSRSSIPKSKQTYFIFNPMTNMIKIGKTIDVAHRMRVLSTQSGCELELLHIVDEDVEYELHTKFKHIRHHGEWFYDDGQIREFIYSEYQ